MSCMKRIRGEEVNGTDWFKDTLLLDKTGLSVVEVEEKGNPPPRKYDFNASGVVPPTIDGFRIESMNETTLDDTDQIPVAKCQNCGYVYGDDLDYQFPNPSICSCGTETELTTVADSDTVHRLASDE